ncbi:LTA synthase family protein [Anaerosacchariphilus polymeriproducens]|uniref:Sulfatase N-terminal domain-containing protein n=1 Tax=Anaerosacchariphilus polymeriproducens TaxID=1812858 RepID=A0A371ARH7_9FIRM|nr:LTA synthase family protein [Anaerosacchariphilus polymeriproducens]RDU22152.1 hypothetical protein DWV06_16615 [Anaerosacchariphilus polymeriproducens]
MKSKFKNLISSINKEKLYLISKILMTTIVVIVYFLLLFNHGLSFNERKISATPLVLCIIILLWIKNPLNEMWNKWIARLGFLITPFVCYLLIEFFYGKFILYMKPICILFNLIIYALILFLLYVICNRTKIAALMLCWITFIFGFVSYNVYEFRGFSIVAFDFTSINTAASVSGEYQFTFRQMDYCILLAFIGFSVFLCKLHSYKGLVLKKRVIALVLCMISIGSFVKITYFTDYLEKKGVHVRMFCPTNSYRLIGSALTVVLSGKVLIIKDPAGYALNKVETVTAPYLQEQKQTFSKNTTTTEPNLIVIMNEAYSDLKSIADFKVNQDYMPFYRSLSENTIKGRAYVSVYGGNTANSEFEFMTGNTLAFFPQRVAPLQMYVNDISPSINYDLKQQGFSKTLAMHPYHPGGWNRNAAYPLLGFDQFISENDFENPELVRKYISDQEDFNRIIEEYENSKKTSDDPYYMFNVTMQNHGKYTYNYNNLPLDIKITDKELSDNSKYGTTEVERYLTLIKKTDDAFKNLVNYFKQVDEPTVIVMFGDHQPALKKFQDALIKRNKNDSTQITYQVPFIVWANYDIEEEQVEKTSLNYLSAKVFDVMNLKKTAYQNYLLDLSKDIPAITANGYWGADGKFYHLNDKSSPYYKKILEYKYVQYNGFFDRKNRVEDFFFLPDD